ncbi:energy transducer TonB [Ascidiaceihabitans sp.]|uniref:energy transducer TonB n=1 Tax=Ascidiaceihabitans sp. TaxID=1872644 RepID=UPI003299A5E1
MDVGQVISGTGHVALIGWVLLGGVFQSEPLPIEATEVSVISGADFAALIAGQEAPSSATDVAQPAQPDPVDDAPDVPQTSDSVAETPVPQAVETPPADQVPDVTELAPPPEADVDDVAPELPTPPAETAVLVPEQAEEAVPLPSDRVAPDPVAQPDPEAALDPVQQDAVTESETGETPQETQEATAPEAASDQIVTEAEKPAAAPNASLRPPSRPSRPVPAAQTPQPETQPQTQTTQDDNSSDTDAAVQAALDAALSATNDTPTAPSGPPMSAGEKDALRVAVSSCWNVGSLSSDALQTTVTVSVAMSQDGKPIASSVRMLSSEGGTASAAKQAYETARRAIIRCGARGFPLPADKYDQWKEIEMTFNPERMRIK